MRLKWNLTVNMVCSALCDWSTLFLPISYHFPAISRIGLSSSFEPSRMQAKLFPPRGFFLCKTFCLKCSSPRSYMTSCFTTLMCQLKGPLSIGFSRPQYLKHHLHLHCPGTSILSPHILFFFILHHST